MRILITGGAGFLGSNLTRLLISKGHTVLCLDNLYSSSYENIKELEGNKQFIFINGDVNDTIDFGSIDQVYHLACPASPIWYQKDPLYTFDTCVKGTRNILEIAKTNRAKFLYTSTSEVYGDPSIHPQPETYWGNVNTQGPRSCYDEGKRAAETMIMEFGKKHKLEWKIVRLFNTYGPRMAANDGRVVSNFIMQALNNKPITIYGQGQQTRSFGYVDDTIAGIFQMMQSAKKVNGPINIGNPGEFTMLELAEKIIQKTGSQSKIVFEPLPKDDPKQRKPDITLANAQLKWNPTINLDSGLDKTIAYFRETHGQVAI